MLAWLVSVSKQGGFCHQQLGQAPKYLFLRQFRAGFVSAAASASTWQESQSNFIFRVVLFVLLYMCCICDIKQVSNCSESGHNTSMSNAPSDRHLVMSQMQHCIYQQQAAVNTWSLSLNQCNLIAMQIVPSFMPVALCEIYYVCNSVMDRVNYARVRWCSCWQSCECLSM